MVFSFAMQSSTLTEQSSKEIAQKLIDVVLVAQAPAKLHALAAASSEQLLFACHLAWYCISLLVPEDRQHVADACCSFISALGASMRSLGTSHSEGRSRTSMFLT